MTEIVLAVVNRSAQTEASFETPLDELGLDSLETVDLLLEIEREIGVELKPEEIGNLRTVGDLAAAFLGKAPCR